MRAMLIALAAGTPQMSLLGDVVKSTVPESPAARGWLGFVITTSVCPLTSPISVSHVGPVRPSSSNNPGSKDTIGVVEVVSRLSTVADTVDSEMTPTALPGQPHVHFLNGQLHVEGQSLQVLTKTFATPLFVYSKYPFNVLYNDQFDRFSAPIEKRYDPGEVKRLLEGAGLTEVAVRPCFGWVADGTKPV